MGIESKRWAFANIFVCSISRWTRNKKMIAFLEPQKLEIISVIIKLIYDKDYNLKLRKNVTG